MSELAKKLIKKAKDSKAKTLDLGNCGLKGYLPEELFDDYFIDNLEWLNLGELDKIFPNFIYLFQNDKKNLFSGDELESLSNFKNLTSLCINNCELDSMSFLKNFTKLEELWLFTNQITKIEGLEGCQNLKSLYLNYNQINSIERLNECKNLLELNLHSNQIISIKGLDECNNLKVLILTGNLINDIEGLKECKNLEELNLNSNQVNNITVIGECKNLKVLNLNNNYVSNIAGLAECKNLQTLYLDNNQISKIEGLNNSKNLQYLFLLSNEIKKIEGLNECMNLQVLDLTNNKISKIEGLSKCKNLQAIYLHSNLISKIPEIIFKFPKLKDLGLSGNNIKNVPEELLQNNNFQGNCLQEVRGYFIDLKKGQEQNNEVKLMLIGNGTVGKTSILNRMIGKKFNKEEKSTHAIRLYQMFYSKMDLKNHSNLKKLEGGLKLNIWDFGGQHLFHGMHKVFMKTRALFLLVWDFQSENRNTNIDRYSDFPNHRIIYWLDFTKTLSEYSYTIIVQNKTDLDGIQQINNFKDITVKYNIASLMNVSALNNNGIESLKTNILDFLNKDIKKINPALPISWYKVLNKIRILQSKNVKRKVLTYKEFLKVCKEIELPKERTDIVLKYLNDKGIIFFDKYLFNGEIILDQQWIIDAVYTLFDRDSKLYYKLLSKKGKFTGSDLNNIWRKYKKVEREYFLNYMESCYLCYCISENKSDTDLNERIYLLPSLLPLEKPDSVVSYIEIIKSSNLSLRYHHDFLHEGIIQRFIIELYKKVIYPKEIWRNGIWIEINNSNIIIEADSIMNTISIYITNDNNQQILQNIRKLFKEIHKGISGIEEFYSVNGKEYVIYSDIKGTYELDNKKIPTIDSKGVLKKDFKPYFRKEFKVGIKKIFLSYSHKDEKYKNELDKFFITLKQSEKVETWNDRMIPPGDNWDDKIIKELREADIVLFLVSVDFLNSKYIREIEIPLAYTRENEGLCKVIPIIVRDCPWEKTEFGKFNALPIDGKAIKNFRNRDKVYKDIVNKLDELIT